MGKKKKSQRWGIVAVVAVVIVFGFLSKSNSQNKGKKTAQQGESVLSELASSNSPIEIQENNIDLGNIPIRGGKVEAEFTFRNDGDEPVILTNGQTSCMCTEAIVKRENGDVTPRIKMPGHGASGAINMTIEPGEVATLVAIYDPMAHGPNGLGPIKRDIVLATNSKIDPQIQFSFRGNVVAK